MRCVIADLTEQSKRKDEVLRVALEALKRITNSVPFHHSHEGTHRFAVDAIAKIKEALDG